MLKNITEPIDLRKPTARVAATQLFIATVVGALTFLTFTFLRNSWPKLYDARANRRKSLPKLPLKSLFGWLPVVLKITEEELLAHAGLDSLVFLAFFRIAIKVLTVFCLLSIGVISPIRYYYTGKYDQDGDDEGDSDDKNGSKFSFHLFGTDLSSPVWGLDGDFKPFLLVYVAFAYIFTLLILKFLVDQTKHVIKIRQRYLGQQNSITDRTIRLSGIPPELRDESVLKKHIEGMNIGKVSSVTICREWGPLNRLFKKRKDVLLKLEDYWAEYLGPQGLQDENQRDNVVLRTRVRESFELGGQRFHDEENENDESRANSTSTMGSYSGSVIEDPVFGNHNYDIDNDFDDDERPMTPLHGQAAGIINLPSTPRLRPQIRTGIFGLFGRHVDAIDYYTNHLQILDTEIQRARTKHYPATPTAFITMDSTASAQMAAQAVLDPKVHHLISRLAPAPHDIIWDNIVLSRKERLIKLYFITFIIGVISVTLILPVGYLATLLNPKTIKKFWPGLGEFLEDNEWARNTVSGLLPTYLFTIMNFAIPFLYVWLSSKQGYVSHGEEELSAVSKNFFYIFVNLFLVFTTFGTAANYWEFLSDTTKIAYQLARSLNELSLFYVDLIILQGIGMFPFKLLLLGSILRFSVFKPGCRTPRDYRDLYKPPVFNFGLHLPQPILIFIITIIYSVFSVKILLSGLAYFLIGYFVYKYQLMYSMVHPPHSSGKVWPMVFRRCIVGLLLFQLTLTGTIATFTRGYVIASLLVPLPFITGFVLWNFEKYYLPLSCFIALRAINDSNDEINQYTSSAGGNRFSDIEDLVGTPAMTSSNPQTTPVAKHNKTLDEAREVDQNYEYPYLIQPLDGPWIAVDGDEVVVVNESGTVRKHVDLLEWE